MDFEPTDVPATVYKHRQDAYEEYAQWWIRALNILNRRSDFDESDEIEEFKKEIFNLPTREEERKDRKPSPSQEDSGRSST